jgi:CHAD domain-containing protein
MKLEPTHNASANARLILPKMARKYFEAGRKMMDAKRSPDELHKFRLKTKEFRYTLELFRPVYGPGLDGYIKSLRELQGALGKISDYQAIRRVLAGDHKLESQIERALKGKLKDLRRSWRTFDSDGALKRWRTYLAGEHSKPRAKRATVIAAEDTAAKKISARARR